MVAFALRRGGKEREVSVVSISVAFGWPGLDLDFVFLRAELLLAVLLQDRHREGKTE